MNMNNDNTFVKKRKKNETGLWQEVPYTGFSLKWREKLEQNKNFCVSAKKPNDTQNQSEEIENNKENSLTMHSLGKGNAGVVFKAQNAKDLPESIKTVWMPANLEETEAILKTNFVNDLQENLSRTASNNIQLKYNSSDSPILLLNENITIDYPLPQDEDCSNLETCRFGTRQGGTFVINFYPKNMSP